MTYVYKSLIQNASVSVTHLEIQVLLKTHLLSYRLFLTRGLFGGPGVNHCKLAVTSPLDEILHLLFKE